MANLDRIHFINRQALDSEAYFVSLLEAALDCAILNETDIENIQLQCIKFLAQKVQDFNGGSSSSIRVETAETIMKSNLYIIGLYLNSLPDADLAAEELKSAAVSDLYQKGRKIMRTKLGITRSLYGLVLKNRVATPHEAYNVTLGPNGLGRFFRAYNPDYSAHEIPAALDYQIANPIAGLGGIEYVHKYLANLYLENEFCSHFAAADIEHLLYGYDKGYAALPVNIFELILAAAIGCRLAGRNPLNLALTAGDVDSLFKDLALETEQSLAAMLRQSAADVLMDLQAASPSLRNYVDKILPKFTGAVLQAVQSGNPGQVFAVPLDPALEQRITFISGTGMSNEDYRILISKLLASRSSSDKLWLIREKVKSFGDFEDVLNDARLEEEEVIAVLGELGDVEIAALLRRYSFQPEIQAVELSSAEEMLQRSLKKHLDLLPASRQETIAEIARHLVD